LAGISPPPSCPKSHAFPHFDKGGRGDFPIRKFSLDGESPGGL
jgi:hypothetical protein